MNEVIAGIDIGETKIAIVLETRDGKKINVRRFPTEVESGVCGALVLAKRSFKNLYQIHAI